MGGITLQSPLQPLWQPSAERIKCSYMMRFMRDVEAELGLQFNNYDELHRWSVEHPEQFWQLLWDHLQIVSSRNCDRVVTDADQFPAARWFSGARLNFAENLLRNRSNKTALVARLEDGSRRVMSYAQLYEQVAQLAASLRRAGCCCTALRGTASPSSPRAWRRVFRGPAVVLNNLRLIGTILTIGLYTLAVSVYSIQ